MVVRRSIIFVGTVQGVGFRYRAKEAASRYGLTGWVRNEWDGSVHMEVQGEESCIDRMIGDVDSGTFVHIDGIESKDLPLSQDERGFRVLGWGY